ncbi:MAG: beta-ketoacyl-[acyl-carrier-protein] synthase family protein [Alphaproteobacteria bacterium]|nr:beta-ketoacyl-[acyl-carrier-protein] synthase family protein [Alphaproteobacteria bacterium]MBV8548249.1 beta-ketoacyl-[acyl-carrier-protein] synthase family protein [Alphaproteobacteria bacterium]
MRRIVITGLGVVSPIGQGMPTFEQNLFGGVCGIEKLSFDHRGETITFPAAPVKDFNPDQWMDPKKVPLLDRFAQFAVAAARQAITEAGLTLTPALAERTGVILGTGVGGQNTVEESYNRLLVAGATRVHPFTIPRLMINAAASQISMELGVQGPSFTVASACASAIHAMGTALALLRSGLIDVAVTGGAESSLTFGTLKGWEALRVMAPDLCRPFAEGRAGMVLGEGAGILILETLEAAQARGARIYSEFAGFGMSADAKDLTTPDVNGASRAVMNAINDAGWTTDSVNHINAHGTGTRINDATETAALKQVFGDHARQLAISASKSQFGHALGAAGALEMLATVLAVYKDCAPPTLNFKAGDPDCDLDYVPDVSRKMTINRALNNSFAFGGLNASVAVQKLR